MSKTKNTPEFQKMMDDIELANSFHYAEQEMEREQLLRDLAAEEAFNQAVSEYIDAQKVFIEAQDKFKVALDAYKEHNGLPTEDVQEAVDTTDTLRDMFAGFNPNA